MVKVNKILFPCDFSENVSKVLPYVLSIARKYDSQVYIVYVNDLQRWGGQFIPQTTVDRLQQDALVAAEEAMEQMCEEEMQSCPSFKRMIVAGDPATEILKLVKSEDIDMVIMGTHGRKGVEHAIFGSVAENVVKKSSVPVLVVHPDAAK